MAGIPSPAFYLRNLSKLQCNTFSEPSQPPSYLAAVAATAAVQLIHQIISRSRIAIFDLGARVTDIHLLGPTEHGPGPRANQ